MLSTVNLLQADEPRSVVEMLRSLVSLVTEQPLVALGILALLLLVALVALRGSRAPQRGPRRGVPKYPSVGEYWMAWVPFRDGSGGKDRPCLVVGVGATSARVLYVTSQDRSADDRYVPVDTPAWRGRQHRPSWLQTTENHGADPTIKVRIGDFRRYLGSVEPFNRWVVEDNAA
ncbi:hypothetical protein [Sanguibacter sp. HDW7]|uniref:hypothetical protein n=1 Tax=Sanguibacter sp. HDW7 TaxID=2714931 RepID=UPI00140C3DF8|nr:hypothetical protein [Sanguibacter sp. HDW7]QIK82218.1 hypothetical protein G7063_00215 [Sanguibacter sp. HDW7]